MIVTLLDAFYYRNEWIAAGEKKNAYIPSRPDEYYTRTGDWVSWVSLSRCICTMFYVYFIHLFHYFEFVVFQEDFLGVKSNDENSNND